MSNPAADASVEARTMERQSTRHVRPRADTFSNPVAAGADPWVVRHDGEYFWCASENDLGITVARSSSLTEPGEKRRVWRAPQAGPYCAEVWAPELHRLDGKWYIYAAASNGKNETHRMIVLEGTSDDPTAPFHFKSELYTGDDLAGRTHNRWAIDGTVLEHGGQRYLIWSGWQDHRDQQWLYIAALANPWTLGSARVRLCANDDFLWERVDESRRGRGLNEAPQVLVRNGRVFVVYSASGSWQASYKLGMLELAAGGHPLDAKAWRKHPVPVFQETWQTWGPGHCSFTQSPDGREDWMAFHVKLERTHNWKRAVHVQRFGWDAEGRPDFGRPVDAGVPVARPSGERGGVMEHAASAGHSLAAS